MLVILHNLGLLQFNIDTISLIIIKTYLLLGWKDSVIVDHTAFLWPFFHPSLSVIFNDPHEHAGHQINNDVTNPSFIKLP